MSEDRIAQIRTLLDNWNALDIGAQIRRGIDYADAMATDIAWLLTEVERLRIRAGEPDD